MSENLVKFFVDSSRGAAFEAPRSGDAGFDLRACENMLIEAGKQVLVPTGVKVAIPEGYVGLVRDRSSMALKRIYTHAGVIDAGYRGEIKVVISNAGEASYHIEQGAKIAQMVVVPCLIAAQQVASEDLLGVTERAQGGFGSTGK